MTAISRTMLAVAAALGAGLAVLLGWRLLGPEPTFDPDSALTDQCDDVPDTAERMSFTASDGMTLGGALIGPEGAEVGVVLRQGAGQTICQWLPWAGEVADATGARVLLFDRRGRGSSPGEGNLSAEPDDVVAAMEILKQEGTRRIALAGSSMGNSVMFSAVDRLDSPPCAVISISPVLTSGGVNGRPMERLPANIWIAWEGQSSGVGSEAALIQGRAQDQGLPAPQLLEVDTGDHSIGLVTKHAEVREFLVSAVRSCAGDDQ